jgi:hypothetical protein
MFAQSIAQFPRLQLGTESGHRASAQQSKQSVWQHQPAWSGPAQIVTGPGVNSVSSHPSLVICRLRL